MARRPHADQQLRQRIVEQSRSATPRGVREENTFSVHPDTTTDINVRDAEVFEVTNAQDWEGTWAFSTWS